MKKKRAAEALKVQAQEKKSKIVVKLETSEEESEGEEEETLEVEESEPEEVNEDEEEEEEEIEVEEVEEEVEEEEEEVEEEVEEEEEEEEEEVEEEEEEEEEEDEEEEEEEDEDDESSKRETLRKLLEPLPKEKIMELLKEAALSDLSILASLTQTAEVDPAHRKIFVFGLGWDATSEQVRSVFKKYGDIEQCKVVTDKVTGKGKGYGFVLFKTRKSAQKSLKKTQKKIGSRMASCQLASAGPGAPTNNQTIAIQDIVGRKIFVANVKSHVNPNALRSYFEKFGDIEEGPMGLDNATGKFKGFTMFVYKTDEGCKKALKEPTKVFDGCQLQCRLASQHRNKNTKNMPSATSNKEIGNNVGYGYGGVYVPQLMNPGIMVGQNPMLVSALNQNGISPIPQSFGLSGGFGINTVNPNMMANYGLRAYQNSPPQMGRSSGGTTSAQTARQQSGPGSLPAHFPSYPDC